MFQDKNGNDVEWCSNPEKGLKTSCRNWINDSLSKKVMNYQEMLTFITELDHYRKIKLTEENNGGRKIDFLNLTILELQK